MQFLWEWRTYVAYNTHRFRPMKSMQPQLLLRVTSQVALDSNISRDEQEIRNVMAKLKAAGLYELVGDLLMKQHCFEDALEAFKKYCSPLPSQPAISMCYLSSNQEVSC